MNKEKQNITYLQIIGVSLVVLGHSLPTFNRPTYGTLLFNFIYSFHMPLFFAISGYLFYYTSPYQKNYLQFIKKKAIQLLIPYFIITTIAYFPKVLLSNYALRPIEFSFNSYLKSLIFPNQNPIIFFWFLPTIFLIFLISPILKKVLNSNNVFFYILTTIILILFNQFNPLEGWRFFSMGLVLHYLIFFWIGSLLIMLENKLSVSISGKSFTLISFIFTLISSIYFRENSLILMLTNIIGVLMAFSLVSFIKINLNSKVYLIKKYSYQIYLLSWFPQTFLSIIFVRIGIYPLTIIAMFLAGIFLPIIISYYISKLFPKLNIFIGLK